MPPAIVAVTISPRFLYLRCNQDYGNVLNDTGRSYSELNSVNDFVVFKIGDFKKTSV